MAADSTLLQGGPTARVHRSTRTHEHRLPRVGMSTHSLTCERAHACLCTHEHACAPSRLARVAPRGRPLWRRSGPAGPAPWHGLWQDHSHVQLTWHPPPSWATATCRGRAPAPRVWAEAVPAPARPSPPPHSPPRPGLWWPRQVWEPQGSSAREGLGLRKTLTQLDFIGATEWPLWAESQRPQGLLCVIGSPPGDLGAPCTGQGPLPGTSRCLPQDRVPFWDLGASSRGVRSLPRDLRAPSLQDGVPFRGPRGASHRMGSPPGNLEVPPTGWG